MLMKRLSSWLRKRIANRETLPFRTFDSLFPGFGQTTIRLTRWDGHPTGVRLNELTYLAYLATSFPATRIFEFGTSVGRTTLNLCLNLPPGGRVYSLDLPDHTADNPDHRPYAANQIAEVENYRRAEYLSQSSEKLPVELLRGNSLEFDFTYQGSMDLIFVDGGHSYDVVKSDSENAFRMLKPEGGVVVWHDYWQYNALDVVLAINDLAKEREIVQIKGTRMAIHVAGRSSAAVETKI